MPASTPPWAPRTGSGTTSSRSPGWPGRRRWTAGPIPEILDRLADQLEEAATALEEAEDGPPGDAPTPVEELEEELAALDSHLSTLTKRRRAEITSGVNRDEVTPLRQALRQVSGARYAVRSLRSDVAGVIDSCFSAAGRRA